MVKKSEVVDMDTLSIYLEDDFMRIHILQFEASAGIKPENIFVNIYMKKKSVFSPLFLIETEGREQFIGISFDDLEYLKLKDMTDICADINKAYDDLNYLIDFMDERFPNVIKRGESSP